ncbi:MAG: ABC transporter permease [Thermodesulfobacteriota bacterium]
MSPLFPRHSGTAAKEKEGAGAALAHGLAGFLLFIAIWFLAGQYLFSLPAYLPFAEMLPLPSLKALAGLTVDPKFWTSVLASLRRVGVGILCAFVLGLPLGLLIGFYRRLRLLTNTPIQFLRMVSPLAWMPIALLIFTTFEAAIYFLITVATVWPIILNTAVGVGRVRPQWLLMAMNQGASNRQLITRVLFPATLPYVFTSLRLALGVAWIVLVPVEFLGVSSGLGYLINDARDTLEYDRLMALVLAIGAIGYLLDSAIQLAQRLFHWSWAD